MLTWKWRLASLVDWTGLWGGRRGATPGGCTVEITLSLSGIWIPLHTNGILTHAQTYIHTYRTVYIFPLICWHTPILNVIKTHTHTITDGIDHSDSECLSNVSVHCIVAFYRLLFWSLDARVCFRQTVKLEGSRIVPKPINPCLVRIQSQTSVSVCWDFLRLLMQCPKTTLQTLYFCWC